MKRIFVNLVSHTLVGVIGFGIGVYVLPIMIAPESPTPAEVRVSLGEARFEGRFQRSLAGSDLLHWGEGAVYVSPKTIAFVGELAPGPDYKLYLSPEFVETEAEFLRLKSKMVRVGDVKTFNNFIVPVPKEMDPDQFNTVVVWCETFGQFITAARYK